MRILHITPSYKPAYIYAGVIESVSRLCEGLAEAGHQVDVFTTTANGTSELEVTSGEIVNVDGVRVRYFQRVTGDPTCASPALWRALLKECGNYDIIHLHSWWNFLVVVSASICHLKNRKTVISPRGMLSDYIFTATHQKSKKWFHRMIGRHVLARSIFHATAESEYDECRRLINGWNGFQLPNILSLPVCNIRKQNNAVFTLIFLSRVHPKKGLELLFQAMQGLPFDVRLKIAGSGDETYIRHLAELAGRLGISDKIEWLGWRDRQAKFEELMTSDAFVLTSYNENFANVVIEALHVGTPVIVSEQVGLASFVSDNSLGWVTKLDVPSIRSTLIAAYTGSRQRRAVALKGRDLVERNFSQAALIQQYATRYEMICNQTKRTPATIES